MKNTQGKIKTVFITGASSGIGRQTAFFFAREKYRLMLTYYQNEQEGQETREECLRLGAQDVLLFQIDLTDDQSIRNVVRQIIDKYHQIDILINNAGMLIKGNLAERSFEQISQEMKANLEGPIKLTKECLPYIKESIINIGSHLGLQGKGGLTVYSATKFGLRGLSQSLAKELPHLKIYTVNPCLTATKMGSPEGIHPAQVAEIIFQAAQGNYRAKSGADINVRDYLYGEFFKKIIVFLRFIKNLFSLIL